MVARGPGDPMLLQKLRDRGWGDPVVKIVKRTLNPTVAPAWILPRDLDR